MLCYMHFLIIFEPLHAYQGGPRTIDCASPHIATLQCAILLYTVYFYCYKEVVKERIWYTKDKHFYY